MYKDVNRIMNTVKVEDGHILLKKPLIHSMYGINVKIKQINYFYKWEPFTYWLGIFLNYYHNACEVFKLPESIEDLKQFRLNIRMVLKNSESGKKAFKSLIKLCKIGGIKTRWAKKVFNQDDWTEIFAYIYLYNVLGVKKNLSNVLKIINQVQSN